MQRLLSALLVTTALSLPSVSSAAGLQDLQTFSEAFADLAAKVKPAVVAVQTETEVKAGAPFAGTPFEDFFENNPFFRHPPQQGPESRIQRGLGSGVIVSDEGYILTNNHVIAAGRRRDDPAADRITVELDDRRSFEAKVVGRDPLTDLAVLKIEDDETLPYMPLGDSDHMRVGEWVVAIGNPFGQLHTVTTGIVSALGRGGLFRSRDPNDQPYEDYIQTDAAINPGNSGGALINMRGELVGINTAIVSRSGGYQGIGFAIPVNLAHTVMQQLIEHGEVRRGQLGVFIRDIDTDMEQGLKLPDGKGALVTEVMKDSPAAKAGLEVYDVIVEVDGQPTDSADELRTRIAHTAPGTQVHLKVRRNGEVKTVKVTLGERDTSSSSPISGEPAQAQKLGMTVRELTGELAQQLGLEGDRGVVVEQILPGSPAARAGLRPRDLIVEIDRQPVTSVGDYGETLAAAAGRAALILVHRATRVGVRSTVLTLRVPE